MNDVERSQINMIEVVRKICQNHWSVLNTYMPFGVAYSQFDSLYNEVFGHLVTQKINPKGYTQEKQAKRLLVEKAAGFLSDAMYLYAKKEDLQELGLKVRFSTTAIKTANEKELMGICSQLISDANANLTALSPYGIDADWLAAFGVKISDYQAFSGAPASIREDRKKATAEVKRLIPAITSMLREYMDVVMQYFKDSHPLVYGEYKHGRKLMDTGSRKPALKGCVTDSEGNPVKGLIVRIAGTTRKSITTAKGNFRFIQMKTGKVVVVVFDGKVEVARREVGVPHEGVLNVEM